jgi:hypothetical protein
MLPALQKKLQLTDNQVQLPITERTLEGSHKTAQEQAGTPHHNNSVLYTLKLDADKSQTGPQQNASKPRHRSYKTPKFKTTHISAIVLAQRVTRAKARKATQGQEAYSEPQRSLKDIVLEAQAEDP